MTRTTGSARVSNVTKPPATGAAVASRCRVAGSRPSGRAAATAPPQVPDAVKGRSNTAAKWTVYAFGWPQNRPLVTDPVISRSPTAAKLAFAEPFWLPATLTSRRAAADGG